MVRLNITIPDRLAQKLKKVSNKSRFISEAVEEKMEAEEKQKIQLALSKEYKEMATEEKTSTQDWDAIETEGWE